MCTHYGSGTTTDYAMATTTRMHRVGGSLRSLKAVSGSQKPCARSCSKKKMGPPLLLLLLLCCLWRRSKCSRSCRDWNCCLGPLSPPPLSSSSRAACQVLALLLVAPRSARSHPSPDAPDMPPLSSPRLATEFIIQPGPYNQVRVRVQLIGHARNNM